MSNRRERRAQARDARRFTEYQLDRVGLLFEQVALAAPEKPYAEIYTGFLNANRGSWAQFLRTREVLKPLPEHLRWFALRYRRGYGLRFLRWCNGKPLLGHITNLYARLRFGKQEQA